MSQISIRLKTEDYELLKLYANKKGLTLASAYKEVTSGALEEWKLHFLCEEYQRGNIRMKEAWVRSGKTLNAFLKVLEDLDIDPPHTEIMELKSELSKGLITRDNLFKAGVVTKRESPEIDINK